jgi:hypothetical protein
MWVFVGAVLGPIVCNQAGWVAAEVGRQPFIVYPQQTVEWERPLSRQGQDHPHELLNLPKEDLMSTTFVEPKDSACRATKSRALVAGLPRTVSTSLHGTRTWGAHRDGEVDPAEGQVAGKLHLLDSGNSLDPDLPLPGTRGGGERLLA